MRLIALAAVMVAIYLPTVHYGFVYEDRNDLSVFAPSQALERVDYGPNGEIRHSTQTEWHTLRTRPARFLTGWSFRTTARLLGPDPIWAHAVNIGLHCLNGVLIAAIVWPLGGPFAALWAAGLFWLHPLQLESVAYISGRSELLAAAGALAALWAFLHLDGAIGMVAVALSVAVALIAKESSVMLGLLLPLAAWRFRCWRRWFVPAALLGALAAVPIAWQLRRTIAHFLTVPGWPLHVGQQAAAVWRLAALLLWPVGLSADHDFGAVSARLAVVAFGALLASLALVWTVRDRWPATTFVVCWVVACVTPRLLMPSTEFLTEHHMYAPMAGLAIGLSTLTEGVSQ